MSKTSSFKTLLPMIALLACPSFAADEPAAGASFEDQKKKMLTHLDERIASLSSAKSCVQSAADKEALQACRSKMRDEMRERKEGFREMREKRREARKQKLGK